jgi:hypothetical protein
MLDARLHDWLLQLPALDRRALGKAFAEAAHRGGAYVTRPDGSEVSIPPVLTPAVPGEALDDATRHAHALVRGISLMARRVYTDPSLAALRDRLFGGFTQTESEALSRAWGDAEWLATARVDFMLDEAGCGRALEVNATIPAMQGYSDVMAESFLRAVAPLRDLDADALADDNRRNTDELLASLEEHYERLGGRGRPRTIAIVTRDADAQLGELRHYARRWSARGVETFIATHREVTLDDGQLRIAGRQVDLVYRHIFARRLDPHEPFALALREPARHRILNPVASHLEVKGMLGLLSAAVAAGDRTLPDDVHRSVQATVPWTRLLIPGPSHAPDGRPVADLVDFVRAERAQLVLKRSWDYGGKSVFLGSEFDDDASQARARELLGAEGPVTWDALVDHALRSDDPFVVQGLVRAPRRRQLLVRPDGETVEDALILDLSAYASLGVSARPSGGAIRASRSTIVNILGGGGLVPLLRPSVAERLLGV